MIKHIVVWSFKEGVDKEEQSLVIKEKLLGLKDKISQIKTMEVGINFNTSQGCADLVLVSEFESKEALDSYQKNPIHQAVGAEYIKPFVSGRTVIDYEI